jgi:pimeloyl-ACP methyl ester carboxylesterase
MLPVTNVRRRNIAVNRITNYVLVTALSTGALHAAPIPSTNATTTYRRVEVNGVDIFYREAGPENAPTIVLLHGFPSSSREFDTLIPLLATKYHLIAPDYPGFGLSDAPARTAYTYTFDHLAQTMSDFLEKLEVAHYTVYLHDYGAPIGFRIILAHPDRLRTLIIQNGNIYKAGLGAKWTRIAEYWAEPKAHPEVLSAFLSFEATKERHVDQRVCRSVATRSARDPGGPARRLPYQCRVLPKMAGLAPRSPAPDPRGLGRARPFLHRAGRGSLQTGSTECEDSPARRWAFRAGRKDRRDCEPDPPVHGQAFRMRAGS